MKKIKRSFDIFNLSFLDVVSCAFGAVVLLVLISNTETDVASSRIDEAEDYLTMVMAAERKLSDLSQQLESERKELSVEKNLKNQLNDKSSRETQKLSQKEKENEKLEGDLDGLELVQSSLKSASISRNTANKRDAEVGGIPVDSDYVIFIVDTSGSMKEIWPRVTAEILNVIKIHPKVLGFQMLNDNGVHLISAYAGKWIPDTPKRRASVINAFKLWNSASNSSPVEGLEVALKRYAKPNRSLSIYIFGDEYSGSSYDPVIDTLVKLNTNRVTGKRLAKVHGVGFISSYSTNRFAILMREITKRNGGTFIALPR
jgi:hypothetical protein